MTSTLIRRAAVAAMLLAGGCIPSAPPGDQGKLPTIDPASPTAPVTASEDPVAAEARLVAEWNTLSADRDAARQTGRHKEIAYMLGNMRPEALFPIVDVMGAADTAPHVRVFAVESLSLFMQPAHVEKLGALLDPKNDATARACAASLLGTIRDPKALDYLRGVANDPERRIKFSALLGLGNQGDKTMRDQAAAMYAQPETTPEEKVQIVLLILKETGPADVPILEDALLVPAIDSILKGMIVTNLGRIGDASAVEPLKKSKDIVNEPTYGETVDAAIAVIEERIAAAAAMPTSAAP